VISFDLPLATRIVQSAEDQFDTVFLYFSFEGFGEILFFYYRGKFHAGYFSLCLAICRSNLADIAPGDRLGPVFWV
jgi:hypothetical protein